MAAGSVGWRQLVMRALVDRGIVNARRPPFIYTPPFTLWTPSTTPPSPSWHGCSSSLSHWLSVCWCGHLKSVSNVGRLPRDLEDTLINNHRATSLGESGTVRHCRIVLQQWVGGGGLFVWLSMGHGSHSAEPLSASSIFSLSPCLCLAWKPALKDYLTVTTWAGVLTKSSGPAETNGKTGNFPFVQS